MRRWNDEHPNPALLQADVVRGNQRFGQKVFSRSLIKKRERTETEWGSMFQAEGLVNFRQCQHEMNTRLSVLTQLASRTKSDEDYEEFFKFVTKELILKKGGMFSRPRNFSSKITFVENFFVEHLLRVKGFSMKSIFEKRIWCRFRTFIFFEHFSVS